MNSCGHGGSPIRGLCKKCYAKARRRGQLPALKSRLDRFMEKVVKTDGCWLWTGTVRGDGYGHFGGGRKGVKTGAHRAAYELMVGPIPAGAQINHQCDIKLCVRPEHLRVGTQADNVAETVQRGRWANQHARSA